MLLPESEDTTTLFRLFGDHIPKARDVCPETQEAFGTPKFVELSHSSSIMRSAICM